MNVHTSDRERLIKALDEVWRERRGDVERFGLTIETAHVAPMYGGWVVPVASGAAGGTGYDLARTLTSLQELAEQRTALSISLYLDPFPPSPNGNGKH